MRYIVTIDWPSDFPDWWGTIDMERRINKLVTEELMLPREARLVDVEYDDEEE